MTRKIDGSLIKSALVLAAMPLVVSVSTTVNAQGIKPCRWSDQACIFGENRKWCETPVGQTCDEKNAAAWKRLQAMLKAPNTNAPQANAGYKVELQANERIYNEELGNCYKAVAAKFVPG